MQLKIISLNLAGFKDWETRQQTIVDYITRESPDVLFLQEVKFDPLRSVYSQSIAINKLLSDPFPHTQTSISKFYQPTSGDAFREGLAVLSKFPIVNSETLVLTKQPGDKHPRIVLNVDLGVDEAQVLLSNVHLSNNSYSSDQLEELLRILRLRNEQRIIAGDFNILKLEENKDLYQEEYVSSVDFKKYLSFPSEGHTLDYVLIPKDMKFISLETHEGLSDHNSLAFVLETPNW